MKSERLCYAASVRYLQELGLLIEGEPPPIPAGRPVIDRSQQGLSFVRKFTTKENLGGLALGRTLFAHSEFKTVSFANTDLTESYLFMCNFICVDCANAVMNESVVEGCKFIACNFTETDLRATDFRRSSFDGCVLNSAQMDDAILEYSQRCQLALTENQVAVIDWRDEDSDAL